MKLDESQVNNMVHRWMEKNTHKMVDYLLGYF